MRLATTPAMVTPTNGCQTLIFYDGQSKCLRAGDPSIGMATRGADRSSGVDPLLAHSPVAWFDPRQRHRCR
jgi:hypothetical protein